MEGKTAMVAATEWGNEGGQSNAERRLLLHWFKPSRPASGALVSTLARRYFV